MRFRFVKMAWLVLLSGGAWGAVPDLPVDAEPKVVKIDGLPPQNASPAAVSSPPAGEGALPRFPVTNLAPVPVASKKAATAKGRGALPGMAASGSRPVILRSPDGVNELVSISATQPSMIRTPFADPEVVDNQANADITAIGSNVYVAPKGAQPFGIFITDKQNPHSPVIALTLVPRDVPGQIIIAQPEGAGLSAPDGSNRPKQDTYVGSLTEIARQTVRDRIPAGFTKASIQTPPARLGSLVASGVARWTGAEFDVYQYRVVNGGEREVTLTEPTFYERGVKAVYFYPQLRLEPGQATNLFLLRGKPGEGGME
ncbi:type-F conjugative transfer system secretin TraK [Chromobacterium sp. IIBBL 290-4]|uniref:TraK domain-containing protein n=1 Tax=Chromobacterium sp. IIBBL 290-4 TaxID=2953890 RepID=UPI0020B6BF9D|nr:type-F conjugative transfer system secretin TraK [Chromobacterium sp. IIBBL 290-4]UTH74241.1 type-F conjugative transfer system secretin TraK [Chromobacterium sp. IIBBL 290-4]